MNLRKLLCGLLALCLLMTLAPAALMEAEIEAPVDEVVEELGGEEAEELLVTDYDENPDRDISEHQNDSVNLTVGQTKTFTYGEQVYGVVVDYKTVATATKSGNYKVTVTGVKAGTAAVKVYTILDSSKAYSSSNRLLIGIINVTVTDQKATKLLIGKGSGNDTTTEDITGKTEKIDFNDYPTDYDFFLEADARAADDDKPNVSLANAKQYVWTFSGDTSIVKYKTATKGSTIKNNRLTLGFKKPGTVKITATVNGTGISSSVTLKVTDAYPPKSVKITADPDEFLEDLDYYTPKTNTLILNSDTQLFGLDLQADVKPYDAPHKVTWKTSKKSVACFYNSKGEKKDSIDAMSDDDDARVTLYPLKTGTVTVTASTYNDESATITIKIVDPDKGSKLYMVSELEYKYCKANKKSFAYGLEDYEEVDLYEWDSDDKKVVKGSASVYAVLSNALNGTKWWNVKQDSSILKTLKWSSSKTKVATVSKLSTTGKAKIKFVGAGTTVIKATSSDGKLVASFTLKVNDNGIKKVYFVDEYGVSIKSISMKVGEHAAVYANVVPVEANADTGYAKKSLTYKKCKSNGSSTSTSYITVKSDGEIIANKAGTGYVKVTTYNGKSAVLKVKITK